MKKYIIILNILLGLLNTLYSEDTFNGYTLFTPQIGFGNNSITKLIDNELNLIRSWEHNLGPASMPYLIPGEVPGLENTYLVYPYRVSNPTMDTGGTGGAFEVLDWEGNFIWGYTLSNNEYQHHHDVEPLPNGNILMIAWEKKTASEGYALGREEIDNPLNQIWSTAIFEIQHDGNGGGEIVWEWHLWDHLVQDYCPSCPNYATISEHPELFNINNGNIGTPSGPGGANADWIHVNAVHYNSKWDQIVFSSRSQSEIYVIDHSTTTEEAASHSGGNFGKGGDFLYRWGNPQNYNRGDLNDKILSDQHSINWIPDGYPGEGNFILFNNYHSGSGPSGQSAILEFVPPVDTEGNYTIEEGQPFGPITYHWSYEGNIFTAMQGGAFRQPNGNTLISDADSAYLLEVTQEGEIVWEYYENNANTIIPRAQKYSRDYFDNIINNLLGDLNDDYILNILDIITLVNIILANNYNTLGDMNSDELLNILDLVILANQILEQ